MESPKCPYCIQCDAFVDKIDYSAKLETFEVKGGTMITCVEVSAYCRECGMELYVPEINDMNVLSRDNAYAAAMRRADRTKGKWVHPSPFTDTLVCDQCDWNIPSEEFITNYCPNCGADMREEANDER